MKQLFNNYLRCLFFIFSFVLILVFLSGNIQYVFAKDSEKTKTETDLRKQSVSPVPRVKEVEILNLRKKIGIAVVENNTGFVLPVFDASFYNNLVEALNKRCEECVFIKPEDDNYPDFFTKLPRHSSFIIKSDFFKKASVENGFNAVVFFSVAGIFIEKEEKGFAWFKDVQNMVNFQMYISVYDTVSGAKIYDEGFEKKIDIEKTELDLVLSEKTIDKLLLVEPVEKIIEKISKPVCEALNNVPWQGRISSVSDNRVFLSSGEDSGLAPGNILDVFDIKVIEGFEGQKFYAPGNKAGEIQIEKVYRDSSECICVSGINIKAENIVKPITK